MAHTYTYHDYQNMETKRQNLGVEIPVHTKIIEEEQQYLDSEVICFEQKKYIIHTQNDVEIYREEVKQ